MKTIHKVLSIVLVLFLLGWGISSLAEDDISSAHTNFSVSGIISDISVDSIKIDQSKGSDKSDRTSYDLNISHLNKIETDNYISINKTDLKKGDKIIAQGLTNGSTFFIKRIISFSYLKTEDDVASSTPQDIMISTSTESIDSTSTTTDNTPSITADLINDATENINSTTTESDIISTSTEEGTSTDIIISTTTEDLLSTTTSTTTDDIIDKVIDTVQDIVDVVTDTVVTVVENIIDTVSGDNVNKDTVDEVQIENKNQDTVNEQI